MTLSPALLECISDLLRRRIDGIRRWQTLLRTSGGPGVVLPPDWQATVTLSITTPATTPLIARKASHDRAEKRSLIISHRTWRAEQRRSRLTTVDDMGLWVGRPRLTAGEQIRWRAACNWKQGRRACGGFLWLTSAALVFEPNRFDLVTGGRRRRVPLQDIREVGVEAGGTPSLSGGLRRRIRLELQNGSHELLLVNNLEKRLDSVRDAVAAVH